MRMLALKGIFDGSTIKITDKTIPNEPQEVIITFLGSENEKIQQEIYRLAAQGQSLDWLNEEPELYSEADLKVRYHD